MSINYRAFFGTVAFAGLFISPFVYVISTDDVDIEEKAVQDDLDRMRAAQKEVAKAQELGRKQEEEQEKVRAETEQQIQRARKVAGPTAHKQVGVQRVEWKMNGETSGYATITLINRNIFAVKDFKLVCETYGGSNTVLTTRTHTEYDVIGPTESKKLRPLLFKQVHEQSRSAKCKVLKVAVQ